MNERNLAFIYSPETEALSYPPDCPFKTQRAGCTRLRLQSFGLLGDKNHFGFEPRRASVAELKQFHTAHYLEEMQRAADGDLTVDGLRMGFGGPDTPVFKHMFECGAWACGAGLVAADLLLQGRADIAFNLLGGFHHAFPERAAGFCYLNDVALACMKLADAGKRVLYLDVDAHHGDGVQAAFYDRKDVMTISLHESGKTLFPWGGFENEIGEGAGRGYNVNVPLPAETYDEAFLTAFDSVAVPLADAFPPDVLVLELGMDILAGDPLTHLRMTNNVVVEIVERVLKLNCPDARRRRRRLSRREHRARLGAGVADILRRERRVRFRPRHGRRDARQHGMGGRPARPRAAGFGGAARAPSNRSCEPRLKL